MSSSFLEGLSLDGLTPARLWSHLPAEVRALAASAVYSRETADATARHQADASVARALRFRDDAVRRLPADKRADYLLRAVRPDDTLASALLRALHLGRRRPMLTAFLDAVRIPHEDGIISRDHRLVPPPRDVIEKAAALLFEEFPAEDVEIYLATLLSLDPEIWGGVLAVLEARRGSA